MANSSGGGARAEAERWLEIAGRLLAARDLVGSKRFAERAMETDPMLEGVDSVLAVADVLLASQRRIGPHHVDWYAVLGVDSSADEATIRKQHHRLAMLLRPEVNSHAGAEAASHLVADALSLLTDPSKKKLIDNEIKKQSAKSSASPSRAKTNSASPKTPAPAASTPKTPAAPSAAASASAPAAAPAAAATSANGSIASSFWTACPFCCHLHQYERSYKDRSLLCPNSNCRRPFHASELPVAPPVVPGTDTYYSAWGFFPMGFPKPSELDDNWKPFHPVFPWSPNSVQGETNGPNGTPETIPGSATTSAAAARGKKTMARKKVGRPPKKQLQSEQTVGSGNSGGNAGAVRGININEEAKGPDGGGQAAAGVGVTDFQMDVDSTDELLGNLQNIPFLRETDVPDLMAEGKLQLV